MANLLKMGLGIVAVYAIFATEGFMWGILIVIIALILIK